MTLRFLDHLSPSRRAGYLVGVLVMALTLAPAVVPAMIPKASAACRDAEVVFARGRQESPGAGILGNAFVSALRSKTNKNIGLYAVQYPADTEVAVGANDMSAHVQSVINSCPDTRIVLGGYSLGAAVTDVVMAAPGAMFGFTNPLPPGADQHIAAVALFGNGSHWVGPIANFSRIYADRIIDLATAPIRSATRPTRTLGRITGVSTSRPAISRPAWSIRRPTSSPANWPAHSLADPQVTHSGVIVWPPKFSHATRPDLLGSRGIVRSWFAVRPRRGVQSDNASGGICRLPGRRSHFARGREEPPGVGLIGQAFISRSERRCRR